MSSDPLQYLPVDQWHKLKEAFKLDWPRSISGYTILDTAEHIIKHGLDYGFKVYCPYGDVTNGMVALNQKSDFHEILIQCPQDDTKNLELALKNTKLIDWPNSFEVPYTPKHVMECVKRAMAENNLKEEYINITETFVLNKETPFDVTLPSGFSFEPLTLDHTELVDSVWPHRYSTSIWYYELLTKAGLGYGLFNNKELISWVFVKEMGGLGHLYTLDKYRRKGYGEMTLKLISNLLMKQGKTVFAFCVLGNTQAHKMYKKLGFEHVHSVEWCLFKKSQIQ